MNRLSKEKSPYLLQHAANPVDWFPWGEEAFAKARQEDKPVFLSIGYSTCHWCHVMEEGSFEDLETAKTLNGHFISIKVDREERPDIDSVYMSYVQAVTGSGGWPMSVFLTPEGKPFYGGTYFPPKDRWGMPGFQTLLKSIAESWKSQRRDILESADSAVQFLNKGVGAGQESPLRLETLNEAFKRFDAGFDKEFGGFGRAPKFPRSHALSFLLRYWLRAKEPAALAMVEQTLDAMAAGGLYDRLEGGFHRYSTDARWRIPHFEKMLYDQALLVQTYLDAFQATGKETYARVARQTLDYVRKRMTSPDGAFYSAEDADSADPKESSPPEADPPRAGKKREGAFYVWEKSEIEKALGADAAAFCAAYGIEEQGNALSDPQGEFKYQNVLYLPDTAKGDGELLERCRERLLRLRGTRKRPHLDDKVLTDWNAMMITAFARAAAVFGEPRYAEEASAAARFLETMLKDGSGQLLHRFRDGEAAIAANLNDHAFLIDAYLHLYEAAFEAGWLLRARDLADTMIRRFWDKADGGFYLTASDAEVLISRPKEIYDGAIPSGNSAAALGLARLSLFTGERTYADYAERTLRAFSETVARDPSNYPLMLQALDLMLGPVAGKPSPYVCNGYVCKPPATDADKLGEDLKVIQTRSGAALKEALKLGQSIWYDGLLPKADLERMIREDGLRGATTNPVILEKSIAGGSYDAQIQRLAAEGRSDDEICKSLAIGAVQEVCDVFEPIWRQTAGQDGFVSIEVSPLLAYDTLATIREAKELHRRVARKNVMIKIPATEAGLPAIEAVIADGISVNVTLIFSVARYREVMAAYFSGLEKRSDAGHKVTEIASVASFFVSRVDTAIDKLLEQKAAATKDPVQQKLFGGLLGKAGIANSKAAYAAFEETLAEERFQELKAEGAQVQRPLWASTGTKNPAYSDVLYAEALIGPNTVDTMPPATLDAFRDHGKAALTLTEGLDEAKKTLEKLAFCGVSMAQVTSDLERAGVELFAEAYHKIIQRIREKKK